MKYDGKTFTNERVTLDDNEFFNCKFNSCTLVYHGSAPPQLSDDSFHNVKFVFNGPAANTIAFLKAMATVTSGMQHIVKDTFPEIFGQ